MNERKDLSDFDEDQIVIKASQKGKSCGMFLWAVCSGWYIEGQPVVGVWVMGTCGERILDCLF